MDPGIARSLKIKIPVYVNLAERDMRLSTIMHLLPGAIIEFKKSSEEPLDLIAGKTIIGHGEAVIVQEHFGLQVKEILNLAAIRRQWER
ncbi:MAG: FliM/FliN family flagellar motor switch protein [Planctomycetota bacterium]